jgi:hypothetical protein
MDPIEKDKYKQSVLSNVERYGWHCTSVKGGNGSPSFTYSIGIFKTYGKPELIVFGLPSSLSHGILSDIFKKWKQEESVDLRNSTEGILKGYPCYFAEVPIPESKKYALSAHWFYDAKEFPLYQVVWPSDTGKFPWDTDASPEYIREQPLIGLRYEG